MIQPTDIFEIKPSTPEAASRSVQPPSLDALHAGNSVRISAVHGPASGCEPAQADVVPTVEDYATTHMLYNKSANLYPQEDY
jgi:hypothetical protein